MVKWITVAPVIPEYNKRQLSEISLGEVKIKPIPDWIKGQEIIKHLSTSQKMRLEDSKLMFAVEYDANSLGDPDPNWIGDNNRGKQDIAFENIRICNLALWLVKPSNLGFELLLHIDDCENNPLVMQSFTTQSLKLHFKDENNLHEKDDFELGRELILSIKGIERRFSVWMSIRALSDALTADSWEVRYLLLWIILEALFGTDVEITYRLSQRISFFLSENKKEAQELFLDIKKGYKLRSQLVHGLKVEELKKYKDESAEMMHKSEFYVRKSLTKILLDEKLIEIFNNEKKRNEYLDGLVFS